MLGNNFYITITIPAWFITCKYSLRLFKIDPVVSPLPATHQQYFILALPLPLRWLRITFVLDTLIALKELLFRPVT
jgi:hypothetical protein